MLTTKDYFFNDFAHEAVANVLQGTLKWFTELVSTQYQTKVISSYHRAVELIKQRQQYSTEDGVPSAPALPAICLDPTLGLRVEEKTNFLWRFPANAGFSTKLYQPILQDEDIRITPLFNRIKLTSNLIMWFDSIYQNLDMQLRLMQWFNGFDRWVQPIVIQCFCPLPNRVYRYEEPGTPPTVWNINWPSDIYPRVLETTSTDEAMLPLVVYPMYKLTDLGDDTKKYEVDSLAQSRLMATIEMEFEIPVSYLVQTYWRIKHVNADFIVGGYANSILRENIQLTDHGETDPDTGIYVPDQTKTEVFTFEQIPVQKMYLKKVPTDDSDYPYEIEINDPDFTSLTLEELYQRVSILQGDDVLTPEISYKWESPAKLILFHPPVVGSHDTTIIMLKSS